MAVVSLRIVFRTQNSIMNASARSEASWPNAACSKTGANCRSLTRDVKSIASKFGHRNRCRLTVVSNLWSREGTAFTALPCWNAGGLRQVPPHRAMRWPVWKILVGPSPGTGHTWPRASRRYALENRSLTLARCMSGDENSQKDMNDLHSPLSPLLARCGHSGVCSTAPALPQLRTLERKIGSNVG